MTDAIPYPLLLDQAMRGMVRDLLKRTSADGLPGEHHFFVSFYTNFPGVQMSEGLRAKYPKEITIVLQHQFWDFKVDEQKFQVTLSFSGMPEKVVVPFAAITAFADPSVKFALQFQPVEMPSSPLPPTGEDVDDDTPEEAAEIISLDAFRKK